jgi:hypothetical protein
MLIPPFFLLASVLWAAYLSGDLGAFLHPPQAHVATVKDADDGLRDEVGTIKSVLSVIAVAGVATLPLGYAIGVLTLIILGFFSPLFPQRAFDVPVSDEGMKAIWGKLGLSEKEPKKRARYGAAIFDHYLLKKPAHNWLFRRWSAFLIASQCVLALALSIPFAHALHIHITCKWIFTVAGVIALFVWQARTAWSEAYQMFELVTSVDGLSRDRIPDKLAHRNRTTRIGDGEGGE